MNTSPIATGVVLDGHLKMIHQIAWKLHMLYGHDLQDLYSEGCLQYLILRKKYNPQRHTKFTTFMWTAIKNNLLHYMRDTSKVILQLEEEPMVLFKKPPVHDVFMHKAF